MKSCRFILFLGALLVATGAEAAVLSVNFLSGNIGKQKIFGGPSGVVSTAAGDWLNFDTGAGLTATDILGSTVDVSVSKAASYVATAEDAAPTWPDGTDNVLSLYSAGLRDSTAGTPEDTQTVISGLTDWLTTNGDTEYRLIIYYKSAVSNADPEAIEARVNGGPWTVANTPDDALMNFGDTFVEHGNSENNWMQFTGLTADSLTVDFNRVDRDGLMVGFQLESVPEPSTFLIALLGILPALQRRR